MSEKALPKPVGTPSEHGQRFLPIPLDSLDFRAHDLDLYICYRGERVPALYRAAGTQFTRDDADRLVTQNITFLHIPASQYGVYRGALSARLERLFSDPESSRRERARVVRVACTKMIEDVLLFPDRPEPIAAVSDLARLFTGWAERDPEVFSHMLDMSDHDFYTTTHMVNVGVGCGLLAARLRPDDRDFIARVCQGGLLHDLGKRDVPPEVLNKEGKLSEHEWGLIRQHPLIGHAELARCGGIPPEVLEMTRDHHERLDGKGYPEGRSAGQLSLATRICSVVDVFDALTAARPYRGPMPPGNALRIMEEGVGTQFDEGIFCSWRGYVEELLCEDPSRAAPAEPPERFGGIGAYSQEDSQRQDQPIEGDGCTGGSRPADGDSNRRRFGRSPVSLTIEVEFVRQLKQYPVGMGERFTVRTVDISRGGMQLETPWPLTINDLLIVHLTTPKGVVRWRARVARVRGAGNGWRAGLQLLCEVTGEQRAA